MRLQVFHRFLAHGWVMRINPYAFCGILNGQPSGHVGIEILQAVFLFDEEDLYHDVGEVNSCENASALLSHHVSLSDPDIFLELESFHDFFLPFPL